nr:mitochondrial K+-H+ exchange-related protein [uncultured bacterium]
MISMNVYLVPIGHEHYELYCEVPDEPVAVDARASEGFFRRLKHRFSAMLAEAERERRLGAPWPEHAGWAARLKARTMRWVAETVAEQRLLWHLRRQGQACLFHPDDLDDRSAMDILRRQLRKDFDRHRFWLIIDSLLFVASGVLFFVPGPNIVAYYFAFRMVGHYLSMRGARQGLDAVEWTSEGSAPLSELRRMPGLDSRERERRVHDVARALNLEHLVKFFERTMEERLKAEG